MQAGDVGVELARRVVDTVRAAFDHEISVDAALIRPAAPGRGADYQSNAAMSLAKPLGRPPREIADAIVAGLDRGDLIATSDVSGPGFVNFSLSEEWLAGYVTEFVADPRLGVAPVPVPGRYVVDYSGPNVAKEMHVGHLRATVIGDAIVRLLTFAGHEVIRRNHLGDWGTPFGMLIEDLADQGWAEAGTERSVADLNAFYRDARKKFESDPGFADRSRTRVVALQGGDELTMQLWRELVAESERHFQHVYELLGVLLTPGDSYGESFYNPFLADTVRELEDDGLARVSEGALCVFPAGFTGRDGDPLPIIIRKTGGGYTYGTTDLAAVRYWAGERGATDLVYVVGAPQRQHFAMVFQASTEAGWLVDGVRAVHVPFGSVLGEDGKMLRSRAGDSIKLVDLIEEAITRSAAVIQARSELDEVDRQPVARAVGVGAIKYADLSSDREKDYVFAWDKMLAMEGNTSVYLQYANARIRSVLRKSDVDAPTGPVVVAEPAERALALKLAQLPAALEAATTTFAPHKLTGFLYELAVAFSAFYEQCSILAAESPELRTSRLTLAAATSQVLVTGLGLLGIEAPDRL